MNLSKFTFESIESKLNGRGESTFNWLAGLLADQHFLSS